MTKPEIRSTTDHASPSVRTVTAREPEFSIAAAVNIPDNTPRKVLSRAISSAFSSVPVVSSSSVSVEAASSRSSAKSSAWVVLNPDSAPSVGAADRLSALMMMSSSLSSTLSST